MKTQKSRTKKSPETLFARVKMRFGNWRKKLAKRRKDFLARRPHRSFRRTLRRDYKRSLKLPGYVALTARVWQMLVRNKRIFLGLAAIYGVAVLLLSSMMSQETYAELREVIDAAQEEGTVSTALAGMTLFWSVLSNQLSGSAAGEVGSSQQIFTVLLGLFVWLAIIWLLRAILAGKKPKIRDGLYNSGGPVLALLALMFVLLIQMIPAAAALIAYGAADASGLLDQTAVLMLFGGGAILLATLSLYWATSTFLAMVVVALPGMYPMQAIKIAGDLAVGRRIRILLRLLWSIVLLLVIWLVVLLPIILLDGALKSAMPDLEWLPLVPFTALMLMAFSVVFEAAYIYLFYRKVVEDDSAPA